MREPRGSAVPHAPASRLLPTTHICPQGRPTSGAAEPSHLSWWPLPSPGEGRAADHTADLLTAVNQKLREGQAVCLTPSEPSGGRGRAWRRHLGDPPSHAHQEAATTWASGHSAKRGGPGTACVLLGASLFRSQAGVHVIVFVSPGALVRPTEVRVSLSPGASPHLLFLLNHVVDSPTKSNS